MDTQRQAVRQGPRARQIAAQLAYLTEGTSLHCAYLLNPPPPAMIAHTQLRMAEHIGQECDTGVELSMLLAMTHCQLGGELLEPPGDSLVWISFMVTGCQTKPSGCLLTGHYLVREEDSYPFDEVPVAGPADPLGSIAYLLDEPTWFTPLPASQN